MDRHLIYFKRYPSRSMLLLGLLSILVLSGCATNGANGPLSYGNPFHKHVRYLPENQADLNGPQQKSDNYQNMSAQELEQQGDNLLRQGRLAGAFAKYQVALTKAPDTPGLRIKMARTLTLGGFHDDALKLLKETGKEQPRSAAAWEVMGIASFNNGTYEKALAYFNNALEMDADRWQSYNYKGQIHDIEKKHALASKAYGKAISLHPRHGFLHNNLGVSNALAGKHRRAVRAFRKAIRLRYASAKVYNNLGTSLAALGRYAEAFEAFKKGVGEAQAHNNIGCMYMLAGEYEAAIQSFERAIAMSPRFYTVAYDNLRKAEIAFQ